MRRERLYLHDIVEAADHTASFIAGIDFEGFQESELVRSAVVQKLSVNGEAATRVSEEVRCRYPQVPWPQIVAFRNLLVHGYFGIDWHEVWQIATERRPVLREQVAGILTAEFGGPEDECGV